MAVAVPTSLMQLFDNSGNVLNGGSVTVYEDGSTTLIDLFSDDGLSSGSDNPITLDSAGRHAMRYFSAQSFKLLIKNSAGSTIATRDDIDPGVPIGTGVLAIANGGTGAATAGAAVTALGAATQSSVDDLAADVAALAGAASSTEKTHIATGTTAQRPASPADGDIRRNTTIPQWEGYSGAAAAWQKFNTSTETTAEIAAALGLVYISTGTASNSSTIDFTGLGSTYASYEIHCSNIKPQTDDKALCVRIGTGATPTYQTSGYHFQLSYTVGGASAVVGSTVATLIQLTPTGGTVGAGNASGENVSGVLRFNSPDASDFCLINWAGGFVNAAGNAANIQSTGMYASAGAITAIRFLFDSGNISSGTFRLYGVRKS